MAGPTIAEASADVVCAGPALGAHLDAQSALGQAHGARQPDDAGADHHDVRPLVAHRLITATTRSRDAQWR